MCKSVCALSHVHHFNFFLLHQQTPLHLAAEKGRFENTLKYLVDKGAGITLDLLLILIICIHHLSHLLSLCGIIYQTMLKLLLSLYLRLTYLISKYCYLCSHCPFFFGNINFIIIKKKWQLPPVTESTCCTPGTTPSSWTCTSVWCYTSTSIWKGFRFLEMFCVLFYLLTFNDSYPQWVKGTCCTPGTTPSSCTITSVWCYTGTSIRTGCLSST